MTYPGGPQPRTSLARLDVQDTVVLKGLAISFIVLHNFFHAVNPARQNEFRFHPGSFAIFLQQVRHAPLAIQAFFSYYGFLGITVFIFLSAYGLAMKHWDDPTTWTRFMAGRIAKLYPIFGLIVLPWTLVVSFQVDAREFLHSILPQIALLFMGLYPLVPGYDLPPVGPWWFIPYIVEFYAIFFLLRSLTREFGWQGLVVLAVVGVAVSSLADPWLARWDINLLETPFGRMPGICLGIAAARYPVRIPAHVIFVAGAAVILGSAFAVFWPFMSFAALLVVLSAYMELRTWLRKSWLLERLGRYSIILFLCNAIIRNQLVPYATSPSSQLLLGAINAVVCFLVAAVIHEFVIDRKNAKISVPVAD